MQGSLVWSFPVGLEWSWPQPKAGRSCIVSVHRNGLSAHDCPPSGVLTIGNLTSSCEQRVQSSINGRQLYGRDYAGAGIHSLINWLAEENEIFRCLLLTLISLKLLLLMDFLRKEEARLPRTSRGCAWIHAQDFRGKCWHVTGSAEQKIKPHLFSIIIAICAQEWGLRAGEMDRLVKAHAISCPVIGAQSLRTHRNLESNGLTNLKLFSYSKFLTIECAGLTWGLLRPRTCIPLHTLCRSHGTWPHILIGSSHHHTVLLPGGSWVRRKSQMAWTKCAFGKC